MTQQVRVNFLNWRPDAEALGNDGLTIAENVLHDTEGYKEFRLDTAGSASTAVALAGTVVSAQVRQVGSVQDGSIANKMHCVLENRVASSISVLYVFSPNLSGSDDLAVTMTKAGGTTAAMTDGDITAFEVCELNNYVFVTAEATGDGPSGTDMSARITAYMEIDLV